MHGLKEVSKANAFLELCRGSLNTYMDIYDYPTSLLQETRAVLKQQS